MRALVFAAITITAMGCAALNSLARGGSIRDVAGAAVSDGAKIAQLQQQIDTECVAVAARPVPWEEELAIGGAVTLAMASKTKGVYIEPSPELPAAGPLDPAQWRDRKPAPATGPKTNLHVYLNTVGKSLAAYSERPGIDWKFVVIEDDGLNAFSAPGGYVMVTTGVLKLIENEAQLADVLAHEIAHVTHRHAITAYQDTKKTVCTSVLVAKRISKEASGFRDLEGMVSLFSGSRFDLNDASGELVGKLAEPIADFVINQGVGAGKELDADASATELLIFAGYNPAEYKKLLAKLPDGGMGHPPAKDRQAQVDKSQQEFAAFASGTLKAPPVDAAIKVVSSK